MLKRISSNYFQLAAFHILEGLTLTKCKTLNDFNASHDYSSQVGTLHECVFFNLFDFTMTDHFTDVRMLFKCPPQNGSDGYIYDDTSNIIRNNFAILNPINM